MRTDRYDIDAKADAETSTVSNILDMLNGWRLFGVTGGIPPEGRERAVMVLLAPKRPAGLKPAADGETDSIRFSQLRDPTFTSIRMSAVANYLSQMWQSPVVDQTGLVGAFDFSLEPSAMDALPGEGWSHRVREAVLAFGFRIETRKVSTELTVVDRCERPGEN